MNRRLAPALALFLVLVVFFISGASGLIYQVVWTRKLALLFGTTSYAISTVLSIFFLGLGFGSLIGGRIADRSRRPLLLYAACEFVIAVWAIVFILLIGYGDAHAVRLLQSVTDSRLLAIAVRAGLAMVYLAVPVFLMGATLPLLAKHYTREMHLRGRSLGLLYGVNTFGAVAGCAAAGFWILPLAGYTRATVIGAVLNALAGVGAVLIWRFGRASAVAGAESPGLPAGTGATVYAEQRQPALARGVLLFAFALSGFCALALEVVWTRMLTLVFIGTTFAYTTMLTAILVGIAVGSWMAGAYVDRLRNHALWFGVIQGLIGVTGIAILAVYTDLPSWMSDVRLDAGGDWSRMVQGFFGLSFLALLPPTLLMGLGFPFIIRALVDDAQALGRHVGLVYSVNTLGGVLGSAVGGFVLLPWLGTQHSIVLLCSVLLASGMGVVGVSAGARPQTRAIAGAVLAGLFAAAYAIAPSDISKSMNSWYLFSDHVRLYFKEGVEGTVQVSGPSADNPSDRALFINAVQATMSIEKGVRMNRFQGVLPLVFEREPKTALFMCLGSGVTVGTLAQWPFDRIDAVELSADVLSALPLFAHDNLDVANNPRVTFHVNDGRHFLMTTENRYDVITFEPMPLALSGVSTFYTEDYYRLCLDRLNEGGIVSQWVPLHGLSAPLVRDLTLTFNTVFPYRCAWFINNDLFLTGSNRPLRVDYATASSRLDFPSIRDCLSAAGFQGPMDVLGCLFMGRDALDRFADGGRVMTDDAPFAEFEAPKVMHSRKVADSLERLIPLYEGPSCVVSDTDSNQAASVERRRRSTELLLQGKYMAYRDGPTGDAEDLLVEAVQIDPDNSEAKRQLREVVTPKIDLLAGWHEFERAHTLLRKALDTLPDDQEIEAAGERLEEEESKQTPTHEGPPDGAEG